MKRFTKKLITTLLLASLLATYAKAIDFEGLGTADRIVREDVGGGLVYTELATSGENGPQRSYIFEYTPGEGTLPLVSYGNVYGRNELSELITSDTLAAINGDFYSLRTGVPMGVMINGGRLVSSDDDPENPRAAIGFTADGGVIIGKPEIKLAMTRLLTGETVKVEHFNKYPSMWGAYLLDSDFGETTTSTESSTEIVIRTDGTLSVGKSVVGVIEEIRTQTQNGEIPKGRMVLTVTGTSAAFGRFADFSVGDEIAVSVSAAEGWENVVTAIGGGDIILKDGVMPEGIIDEDHEKYSNPRTAVGVRKDGTVIFYAVDGRSKSGKGLTETGLSDVMAGLGCVSAINLDGGGSTSVIVKNSYSGEQAYVNTPSDGKPRTIGNALLLVPESESDGIPYRLVSPGIGSALLRGSSLEITAWEVDRAFRMTGEVEDIEISLPEDAGSADGNIFTAGMKSGLFTLGISSGKLSGNAYVTVTDKLDSLGLFPTYSRALKDSDATLSLDAKYRGESPIADVNSFYFTLDGKHIVPNPADYPDAMIICGLGYLTKDLRFVAFDGAKGEVEVGIWFDEHVSFVKIRVGEGDEEIPLDLITSETASLFETSPGYRSDSALGILYTYDQEKTPSLLSDKKAAVGAKSISLWLDKIPDSPYCVVTVDDGKSQKLSYTVTKDYSRQLGYVEVTAEIPEKLAAGTLTISTLLGFSSDSDTVLKIGGARISYGDKEIPAISGLDGHFAKDAILRLYEMGAIQNYDCVAKDGEIFYSPDENLTRGEFAKLLSLWLGLDAYDYLEGESFEAGTPEDKLPYIRAVIAAGLMSGTGTENGVTVFRANDTITRQEVCKVIGGIISGTDSGTNDGDSTKTAFTDEKSIADWAKEGVSRCAAAGIISGYEDKTIRPGKAVTRGELAVMLGRTDTFMESLSK